MKIIAMLFECCVVAWFKYSQLAQIDIQHISAVATLTSPITDAVGIADTVGKKSLYSIILLTQNAPKRGLLAFPGLVTWNTLARHLKSVGIRGA